MNIEILLAFTIGMIILAASPGPGVLGSVSKALSDGFGASLLFIAGLVLGDIVFFSLALVGVSAISSIMGQLFFVIKIIGGCYLFFLGIKAIFSKETENQRAPEKSYKSFVAGFLVTMGNPKPILFYASIVPSIINIRDINSFEVLAMIAIIAGVSFLVIGSYCYLATISKSVLASKKYKHNTNIVAGIIMMLAGVWVVLKKS